MATLFEPVAHPGSSLCSSGGWHLGVQGMNARNSYKVNCQRTKKSYKIVVKLKFKLSDGSIYHYAILSFPKTKSGTQNIRAFYVFRINEWDIDRFVPRKNRYIFRDLP